jgi:hypothetical protein
MYSIIDTDGEITIHKNKCNTQNQLLIEDTNQMNNNMTKNNSGRPPQDLELQTKKHRSSVGW